MSWWWIRRRPDGAGWSTTSINIGCLSVLLAGLFIIGCARLAPPYGAVAVMTVVTGWLLVALAKVVAREDRANSTANGMPVERFCRSTRCAGLALMVAGLAVCLFLVYADLEGWIEPLGP